MTETTLEAKLTFRFGPRWRTVEAGLISYAAAGHQGETALLCCRFPDMCVEFPPLPAVSQGLPVPRRPDDADASERPSPLASIFNCFG